MADDKPTLDELIAAINAGPTGGTTTKRRPLGVPAGFVTERTLPPSGRGFGYNVGDPAAQPIPPRYYDGDEMIPASWGSGHVAALQAALNAAGLYGKGKKFRKGYWSDVDAAAYRDLLSFANRAGIEEREALGLIASAPPPEDEEEKRQPLVTRPTNPDDLREVFETVARTRMGKRMPREWIDGMIAAYQAQEENYQRMVYDATASGATGGRFTQPPSPEAFASQEIKRRDPGAVASNDFLSNANAFFDLVKESANG